DSTQVSSTALQQTFRAAGSSVRLVVLNRCYGEEHVAALATMVDCVVGISGAVDPAAARSFSIGFYGGLGEGESLEAAFEQGCASISLATAHGGDSPQLRTRPGVDARRLILANIR